jgi:hypothetical protein
MTETELTTAGGFCLTLFPQRAVEKPVEKRGFTLIK